MNDMVYMAEVLSIREAQRLAWESEALRRHAERNESAAGRPVPRVHRFRLALHRPHTQKNVIA